MTPDADATLAVLAGGEGSRMGCAKALLHVRGLPILHYIMDRLRWSGPTLLVTAPGREHPPGVERFDREAIDPVQAAGPLRGILTALENINTPVLAVTAVDMPAVEADVLRHLLTTLRARPEALGVMMTRLVDDQTRIEPFPCALRAASAEFIRDALASGRCSVHGLTHDPRFVALPAPTHWPSGVWTNINRPTEWEAFVRDTESKRIQSVRIESQAS